MSPHSEAKTERSVNTETKSGTKSMAGEGKSSSYPIAKSKTDETIGTPPSPSTPSMPGAPDAPDSPPPPLTDASPPPLPLESSNEDETKVTPLSRRHHACDRRQAQVNRTPAYHVRTTTLPLRVHLQLRNPKKRDALGDNHPMLRSPDPPFTRARHGHAPSVKNRREN
eukprot:269690-Prorocentrum_minimum.AAC.3